MCSMKRLFVLVVSSAFCLSCSLLTAITQPAVTTSTTSTTSSVVTSALLAPSAASLTLAEDPGTGLYGYLNEFGLWAIAPQYRYARNFDRDMGLAIVEFGDRSYGAINTLAQVVINPNFTSMYDVESAIASMERGRYCGIDLWVAEDKATGLYGYLNYYGQWAIAPQYLYARSMSSEGFAIVEVSKGQWGAIDRGGNMVIAPNFTSSYDVESALNRLTR